MTTVNLIPSPQPYQYDLLGQVTSGKKYWSDGTAVAGQQFEYGFDDIGNRKLARFGGDTNGANLRQSDYKVNLLNQYTNHTVPGYVTLLGEATNTATVKVNSTAADRKSRYYHAELTVTNTTNPLYLSVTNKATNGVLTASVTGNVLLAKTPEVFTYDLDGNLTSDGLWTNTWDGENRLLTTESLTNVPSAGRTRLAFGYDYLGRRVQKVVSTWNGSAYVAQSTNKFVYDGWNPIAILDGQSALLQSLVWGLDLSGTMQGAGGVGGLLMASAGTNGAHFVAMDGNGNVAGLVSVADGVETLRCEYEPFGKPLRVTGRMAKGFAFGFSTKYYDAETEALYYGYRYLREGRWLSRDPIGEEGHMGLYGFVGNQSVNLIDLLGLQSWIGPGYGALPIPGQNWPASGGGTVTLDNAEEMLLYFYIGDSKGSYTISQRLIEEAKQQMGLEHETIKGDVRKVMRCCMADTFHKDYPINKYFVLPNDPHTGSWQLKMSADCNWQCGKNSSSSTCTCSVNCKIKATISKRWTFDPVTPDHPNNNPDNNDWRIQLTFNLINHLIHLGGNGTYNISAQFDDSFSTSNLTPDSRN